MDSRLRSSRPTYRATSTNSGTGCRQGATFLRRCGGSIFQRRMVGRDRWAFRRLRTALPRRSPDAIWSRSWNRCSIPIPTAIAPANLRSKSCAQLVSVVGVTTGCSISTSKASSTASTGADAKGDPSPYGLSVGAALYRALVEGAGAVGGRQCRAAHGGNAAGWGDLALAGKPLPALRVRCVDGAEIYAHRVRAVRGRHHL